MKIAFMLVLMIFGPNGTTDIEQIGPFAERRECAEAAVRLTEVARRNAAAADGACIAVLVGA